jgi:CDP-glucose 4,6-dehydratase
LAKRPRSLEDMVLNDFWRGRCVFLTGHTGFMGGWLASLLLERGARVHGYALPPPSQPSFFETTGLAEHLSSSTIGDVRNATALGAALAATRPEIVFHLAAQPLVRTAHSEPIETFSTNVMGTAQVLEAMRGASEVKALLVVTTDKVYRNEHRATPYSEADHLGGKEPYSASKAASEFVVDAFRHSYLRALGIGVATIRAGNVFGGGDWADSRLVPDAMRNFAAGKPLRLRHPEATRPWQHVLDPLPGYLTLAERLFTDADTFASGWNFGPSAVDCRPVGELAHMLVQAWGAGAAVEIQPADAIFEETLLALDSGKAEAMLGWRPRWPLKTAVEKAVQWHRALGDGADMRALTRAQIAEFESAGVVPCA